MDTSEMRELLRGYVGELDWSGGATRDQVVGHLVGRDSALATMVNEYVADGSYRDVDHLMTVIPEVAWQNVQGDAWRGGDSLDPGDVPSNFRDGVTDQIERDTSGSGNRGGS